MAQAEREHDAFCGAMRDRGVEVYEAETLLAEALAEADAQEWVASHILNERQVGIGAAERAREWMSEAPAAEVANFLIGGIARSDVERDLGLVWQSADPNALLLPPLPNFLFQRDPSCWIFDGVTINPMTKPARKPESMIMEAIYRFHPMFTDEEFPIWLGGADEDWGQCHVEGGDVQPIGNGTVMIGMGERTTPQAVLYIARALFRAGSATQVLAVHLPKSRSYMHLDTVITMCDRDLVTMFPEVVGGARTWTIRPGDDAGDLVVEEYAGTLVAAMAEALGIGELRVIPTGGRLLRGRAGAVGRRQQRRRPRARGSRRLRAQHRDQHGAAQGRDRGDHHRGLRARPRAWWLPLHDLPARARTRLLSRRTITPRRSGVQPAKPQLPEGDRLRAGRAALPARPRRRAEGRQVRRDRDEASGGQGDRADLREDLDPHPRRLRGRRPTTRAPTSPTSTRPAHSSATRSRSPTPRAVLGRMFDAMEFRGNAQDEVEELARHAGVPVYNGLTNEWHPTQMLADFLTMHESSHRPYDELSYAFVGDCRFNMGRSLLVMGALMGADVRLAGPAELHPPADVVKMAAEIAERTGARITITDDPAEAVAGVGLHPHRRLGLDGRGPGRVGRAGEAARALPGEPPLLEASGNPDVKFMHCLPAFHDTNTVVGAADHGGDEHARRARGHRRGLQLAGQHRLRPGREPAPHHQGRAGRDPRLTTMSAPAPSQRALGVRQAAFIGVGSMVGAGIFSLLGAAGDVAGAAVWLSFLIAGVVAGLQGYSFAKFGARFPSAGGLLEYVRRGYGDGHFTGIIAWLILATNAIVTGMVAISFGSYASGAVADGNTTWIKVFAVLLILVMAALNVLGSQAVARVQTVVVVVVIGILSVFAVSTLANVHAELPGVLRLSAGQGHRLERRADLLRLPRLRRDHVHRQGPRLAVASAPRAMFLALGIATVIYVAVSLGVFGTLTVEQVIRPAAPRSPSPPSRRSVGPVTG